MTHRFNRGLLLLWSVVPVLLFGLFALAAASAPAAAAPLQDKNATASTSESSGSNVTVIDEATTLISAEYNPGSKTATVTIRSQTIQRISVVDGADVISGGEVDHRTVTLSPGETVTISLPVSTVEGYRGITISTPDSIYSHRFSTLSRQFLIGGPWDAQDVQMGALGGAASVGFCVIVVVIRTITGRSDSPERIA